MSNLPADSGDPPDLNLEQVRRHYLAVQNLSSEARQDYLAGLTDPLLVSELRSLISEDTVPADSLRVGNSFGPGLIQALEETAEEYFSEERPLRSVGQYRILRELGRGGQAAVFLAEDTKLQRIVALKVMMGSSWLASPQARLRFERESTAAAQLDHPGICTVFEAGVSEGFSYIAMRHIEGESLAKRLSRQKSQVAKTRTAPKSSRTSDVSTQVDLNESVILIEKTARALHYAHEAGILHRDIKPGNIMVTDEGEPVLLDFGLASIEDDHLKTLTRQGDVMGTPAYMAPEQCSGDISSIGRTTDVYALGVTLFELLTLSAPFEAKTLDELYRKIRLEDPLSATSMNPRISEDLNTILQVALDKDQQRRYATAHAFAEDLRALIEHRPIAAKRSGLFSRAVKFTRRNRGFVIATGLIMTALSAGIVATTIGLVRANEANRESLVALAKEKEARNEALTVTNFLETMVSDSNRTKRSGEELSFRQALDDAAHRLANGIDGQPRALATLHFIIGNDYYALGVEEQAVHHISESLRLRSRAFGPLALISFQTQLRLGQVLQRNERIEWNFRIFSDMDEHRVLMEELNGTLAARAAYHLGYAEMLRGNLVVANTHTTRAIELGEKHEVAEEIYADILTGHAAVARRLGNYQKAAEALSVALEILQRTHGKDSAQVATIKSNLSLNLRHLGKPDEALQLLSESYATNRKLFGDEHTQLLVISSNLGKAMYGLQKYEEAYAVLMESIAMHHNLLGPKDHRNAYPMLSLGECLFTTGHLDLAATYQRKALKLLKGQVGDKHLRMGSTEYALCRSLVEQGEYEDALKRFGAVIDAFAANPGKGAQMAYRAKLEQIRALRKSGHIDEAETLLVEVTPGISDHPQFAERYALESALLLRDSGDIKGGLNALQKASAKFSPSDDSQTKDLTLSRELAIAETLCQLGQEDKALDLLKLMYDRCVDKFTKFDRNLKQAARMIELLLTKRGEKDQALIWQKRAKVGLRAAVEASKAR